MTAAGRRARALADPALGLAIVALFLYEHAGTIGWLTRSWVAREYDSYGLLALALVIGFLVLRRREVLGPGPGRWDRVGGTAVVAAATLFHALTVRLVLVIIPALAMVMGAYGLIWFFRGRQRLRAYDPVFLLGFFTLPLLDHINLVAGFPLRLVSAYGAGLMLRGLGFGAQVHGTLLSLAGTVVEVDLPCSGVRFLFVGALFALTLELTWGARTPACIAGMGLMTVLVVLANIGRIGSLFLLEWLGLALLPEATEHAVVGVTWFGMMCAGYVALAGRIGWLRPRRA